MEKYFDNLDYSNTLTVFRYRTGNHRLPIETGRFNNIEYKDRICKICNEDIGDEFHYLLKCPAFETERKMYLTKYYRKHPNMPKYTDLMTSDNSRLLTKLSKLMHIIMQKVKT